MGSRLAHRAVAGIAAFIGLVAMLTTLELPSYWTDEGATLAVARRPIGRILATGSHVDGVHTFFYVLMHHWIAAMGTSEWWVRLPSAVCYAATVYLVVRLAQELHLSRIGVWAAAGLSLVLPGLTWVGLEARDFALATALATAHVLALLRVVRGGRGRTVWLLGVTTLLMPFAEIYTVLLLPLEAWFVVRPAPAAWRRWLVAVVPGGLAAAVLGLVLQGQSAQLTVSGGFGSHVLAALRSAFFLGPRNGGRHVVGAFEAATVACLLAGGLLAMSGWRHRDRMLGLLLVWALGPVTIVLLTSLVRPGMFGERYVAFCAPGLVLALARAADLATVSATSMRGRRVGLGIVTLLVALLVPMQINQRLQDTKAGDDYRKLIATLPAHRPQAVWFDTISARSVPAAYPDGFTGVDDVRLRCSGAVAANLWGESYPAPQSLERLRQRHPHRLLVVYARSGLEHSSGATAARSLSCRVTARVPAGRYSFAYYTCP